MKITAIIPMRRFQLRLHGKVIFAIMQTRQFAPRGNTDKSYLQLLYFLQLILWFKIWYFTEELNQLFYYLFHPVLHTCFYHLFHLTYILFFYYIVPL